MSSLLSYFLNTVPTAEGKIADAKEIKIASWNLLNFGNPRANNPANLQTMASIMTGDYTLVNGHGSGAFY